MELEFYADNTGMVLSPGMALPFLFFSFFALALNGAALASSLDCAKHKALISGTMKSASGLDSFTDDLLEKSDLVIVGESHFEEHSAPITK